MSEERDVAEFVAAQKAAGELFTELSGRLKADIAAAKNDIHAISDASYKWIRASGSLAIAALSSTVSRGSREIAFEKMVAALKEEYDEACKLLDQVAAAKKGDTSVH